MAFDISKVGGYGTGSLGNVTVPYDSSRGEVRDYPKSIQTYTSSPIDYYGYNDCYPYNIYPSGLTEGGATLYLPYDYDTAKLLTVGSALLFVQMRYKDEVGEYGVVNNNLSEEILAEYGKYKNFTLSTSYSATPKWSNGRGGICALAVSDTCNLNGGKLNVENKGHGLNTGNELDGNAFMRNHLPLGNGHGSIFLLAKNLKLNTSTRIGATYSGAPTSNFTNYGGKRGSRDFGSKQGAHILIVADKITGLTDAAISTGGDGAGAGYCGSNGVSGAAFICCNDTS